MVVIMITVVQTLPYKVVVLLGYILNYSNAKSLACDTSIFNLFIYTIESL